MDTVKTNDSVTIMRYNTPYLVNISIRDSSGDEVLLLHEDVKFLHKVIDKWLFDLD